MSRRVRSHGNKVQATARSTHGGGENGLPSICDCLAFSASATRPPCGDAFLPAPKLRSKTSAFSKQNQQIPRWADFLFADEFFFKALRTHVRRLTRMRSAFGGFTSAQVEPGCEGGASRRRSAINVEFTHSFTSNFIQRPLITPLPKTLPAATKQFPPKDAANKVSRDSL